jgi:hypothetical protein
MTEAKYMLIRESVRTRLEKGISPEKFYFFFENGVRYLVPVDHSLPILECKIILVSERHEGGTAIETTSDGEVNVQTGQIDIREPELSMEKFEPEEKDDVIAVEKFDEVGKAGKSDEKIVCDLVLKVWPHSSVDDLSQALSIYKEDPRVLDALQLRANKRKECDRQWYFEYGWKIEVAGGL